MHSLYLHKKYLEILLLLCDLHILESDQIKEESNKKGFCFSSNFLATFVTKSNFLLFFEQLFEKLLETFWKISGNLWKALVEQLNKGSDK